MGARTPFEISLTPKERDVLERRARAYTDPYCRVVRAKIVLLAADGLANNEIAARLDTSPQVVHRWRKRFFQQGLAGLSDNRRSGRPVTFGPSVAVEAKQLACELPAVTGVPLSRWSCIEVARELVGRGVVVAISAATVWRFLVCDAIRPWFHRSWIAPRDPRLIATKAAVALDLYAGTFEGQGLGEKGVRDLRRREDERPGAVPVPPHTCAWPGPVDAGRARVRPRRGTGLPGRLRRASGQGLRSLRTHHRHRALRPARQPGHDHRALRLGGAGVLDRRQRELAPWPGLGRPAGRSVEESAAHPPAGPRLLVGPDRDLLLDRATQVCEPERLLRPRPDRSPPRRLRDALQRRGDTVRLEVHQGRPEQAPRPHRRPRGGITASAPTGRLSGPRFTGRQGARPPGGKGTTRRRSRGLPLESRRTPRWVARSLRSRPGLPGRRQTPTDWPNLRSAAGRVGW